MGALFRGPAVLHELPCERVAWSSSYFAPPVAGETSMNVHRRLVVKQTAYRRTSGYTSAMNGAALREVARESVIIPARAVRSMFQHLPQLGTVICLGLAGRQAVIWLAFWISGFNTLAANLIMPLAPLSVMMSLIIALWLLRPSLPFLAATFPDRKKTSTRTRVVSAGSMLICFSPSTPRTACSKRASPRSAAPPPTPRSRGEHLPKFDLFYTVQGSSPLTRGAPEQRAGDGVPDAPPRLGANALRRSHAYGETRVAEITSSPNRLEQSTPATASSILGAQQGQGHDGDAVGSAVSL